MMPVKPFGRDWIMPAVGIRSYNGEQSRARKGRGRCNSWFITREKALTSSQTSTPDPKGSCSGSSAQQDAQSWHNRVHCRVICAMSGELSTKRVHRWRCFQGYLEGIKGSYNVSELLGLANLLRLLVTIECKDFISPHINRKSHAGQCRGRWGSN